MTELPSIGVLAGRAMLATLFILAGLGKILGPGPFLDHMRQVGVPGVLLWPTIALEIVAGAALLIGWRTPWAAAALAGFCLLTAFLFHLNFSVPAERTQFFKDVAIAGGLLALAAHSFAALKSGAGA